MPTIKLGVAALIAALIIGQVSAKTEEDSMKIWRIIKETKEKLDIPDNVDRKAAARDYVIEGSRLEQQRRYAEAVIEFQQALRYDSSAAIYYAAAKCYKQINKLDLAMESAIRAVESDSDFVEAFELMADVYGLRMEYENAVAVYEHLLAAHPTLQRKMNLAQIYEVYDYQKAIILYEQVDSNTDDSFVLERLAMLYLRAKDMKKYRETIEKLYGLKPGSEFNAGLLLESFFNEGDYKGGMQFLGALEKDYPNESLSQFFGRAASIVLTDTGVDSKNCAGELIKKIDNRFYFDWKLLLLGGLLANKADDSLKADSYFRRCLSIADSLPEVVIQASLFYSMRKNEREALDILKSYYQKFSDDIRFPIMISYAYLNMDSAEIAVKYLNSALEIDGQNVEALSQLGMAYNKLGINDSSDMAYSKALKYDPDNPLINNNYAYSLAERGYRLDEAYSMARRALDSEPDNPSYLDTFAWILFMQGDNETALNYILKAIDAGAASDEVYEHLGEIYLKSGKKAEAKKAFEEALEKNPDNKNAGEKLKSLM
ncbi:MAG: Tetratricopeptide repeat protein [Bacteroidota bacterium]|nr:Tetratricopeptide repeat protein [Bacteroidota bacterium]